MSAFGISLELAMLVTTDAAPICSCPLRGRAWVVFSDIEDEAADYGEWEIFNLAGDPPPGGWRCAMHVDCDSNCGALRSPHDPEELRAALIHWMDHGEAGGCSHGC